MPSLQKTLIIGPSWVGDMIMAQSLFIKLKQQNPQGLIDVMAPAWSEPMLAAMPEINESIVMPIGHGEAGLKKRYQLGKALRTKQYDRAIIMPNSFKSALIPFWAKIPERIGFKGEMRFGLINKMHILDKSVLTMTVQRYVALAEEPSKRAPSYPKPALKIDQADQTDTLEALQLDTEKPILALCPGAEYGPAKCWPAKYYADVANRAIEQGWDVWILGSEKDQPTAQEIQTIVNRDNCISLTGKTSLHQVMVLLSLASHVISNDSGLMHVAAAVGTPVISVYGSSDPSYTPPLSFNSQIAYLNLECSPCFKRECPLGHLDCLNKLTPDFVWGLLESNLAVAIKE
ncbi:MAG: lipopolysaccharide heptosyltransferase II [Cocleimonas sp.]